MAVIVEFQEGSHPLRRNKTRRTRRVVGTVLNARLNLVFDGCKSGAGIYSLHKPSSREYIHEYVLWLLPVPLSHEITDGISSFSSVSLGIDAAHISMNCMISHLRCRSISKVWWSFFFPFDLPPTTTNISSLTRREVSTECLLAGKQERNRILKVMNGFLTPSHMF